MAARVIRIRLSCRGRVEYFDLEGTEAVLGRGEGAELAIDHPSILSKHARLLLRRGRLILAEMGGLVALGDERLRAPTTIRDGETFRIGEVEATAWAMEERSHVGRSLGGAVLAAERDAISPGTRRYEALAGGKRTEVTVLDPQRFEPHEVSAWRARAEKASPALIASGEIDGRPAIAERVPAGIRAAEVIESLTSERITVSAEVALAVLRRLAESLSTHHASSGPHASLIPESVQLTMDGDVLLLFGGPRPTDPALHARWCSPMRRMNLPPSIGDDAFALRRMAEALGGPGLARELGAVSEVRTRAAFETWAAGLVALSDRWRVDPSAGHVARVVRLLARGKEGHALFRLVG